MIFCNNSVNVLLICLLILTERARKSATGIGICQPGFGSPACAVSGLVGLSLRGAWAGAHTVRAPACMNKRELAPWGSPPVLLETVSLCALRLEGREGGGFEALAARRLHQYCICFRIVYPHGPSLPQYFETFAGTAFGGTCRPSGHSQAPLSPASGPACVLVVFLAQGSPPAQDISARSLRSRARLS